MSKSFVSFGLRLLKDERLLPSHLSLAFALIVSWKKDGSPHDIKITRREIMAVSKISSISTYHRIIKDLVEYRYINYRPSYDHYEGTKVSLML